MSDVTDLKAEVLLLRQENKELREDLEFERSENGWAREFLNRMGRKCGTKDCPSLVAYVTKLEDENKALLELCEEQLDNLMPEICAKAWWCEGKDWHTCNDDACGNYTFVILARELGVTA